MHAAAGGGLRADTGGRGGRGGGDRARLRPASRTGGRRRAARLGPRPGRSRPRRRPRGRPPAPALAPGGARPGARGELRRLGAAARDGGARLTATLLAAELPDAGGALPWAAAVAVAIAVDADAARAAGADGAVVLIEVGAERARGPTMLAADGARELERELRAGGFAAAARGRLAWAQLDGGEGWLGRLAEA